MASKGFKRIGSELVDGNREFWNKSNREVILGKLRMGADLSRYRDSHWHGIQRSWERDKGDKQDKGVGVYCTQPRTAIFRSLISTFAYPDKRSPQLRCL
jgi:hypothetical protein